MLSANAFNISLQTFTIILYTHIVNLLPHNKTLHLSKFKAITEENFTLNSLPNDKILDQSKLKAFADDKISLKVQMMITSIFSFSNNIFFPISQK